MNDFVEREAAENQQQSSGFEKTVLAELETIKSYLVELIKKTQEKK
jgi:hypothetical protein